MPPRGPIKSARDVLDLLSCLLWSSDLQDPCQTRGVQGLKGEEREERGREGERGEKGRRGSSGMPADERAHGPLRFSHGSCPCLSPAPPSIIVCWNHSPSSPTILPLDALHLDRVVESRPRSVSLIHTPYNTILLLRSNTLLPRPHAMTDSPASALCDESAQSPRAPSTQLDASVEGTASSQAPSTPTPAMNEQQQQQQQQSHQSSADKMTSSGSGGVLAPAASSDPLQTLENRIDSVSASEPRSHLDPTVGRHAAANTQCESNTATQQDEVISTQVNSTPPTISTGSTPSASLSSSTTKKRSRPSFGGHVSGLTSLFSCGNGNNVSGDTRSVRSNGGSHPPTLQHQHHQRVRHLQQHNTLDTNRASLSTSSSGGKGTHASSSPTLLLHPSLSTSALEGLSVHNEILEIERTRTATSANEDRDETSSSISPEEQELMRAVERTSSTVSHPRPWGFLVERVDRRDDSLFLLSTSPGSVPISDPSVPPSSSSVTATPTPPTVFSASRKLKRTAGHWLKRSNSARMSTLSSSPGSSGGSGGVSRMERVLGVPKYGTSSLRMKKKQNQKVSSSPSQSSLTNSGNHTVKAAGSGGGGLANERVLSDLGETGDSTTGNHDDVANLGNEDTEEMLLTGVENESQASQEQDQDDGMNPLFVLYVTTGTRSLTLYRSLRDLIHLDIEVGCSVDMMLPVGAISPQRVTLQLTCTGDTRSSCKYSCHAFFPNCSRQAGLHCFPSSLSP